MMNVNYILKSLHPRVPTKGRRATSSAASLALICGAGLAQNVAPNVAIPFYTPSQFMQGAYHDWYAPQSSAFAKLSATLPVTITALCEADPASAGVALDRARAQWRTTTAAWDRLNGVPIGPLLQRRSTRQIDFTPTRPELIVRAIQTAPDSPKAMEQIGTPAKGLPALEWLLWTQPIAPDTPACHYAVQVAADVARESTVLSEAFAELAAHDPEAEGSASVPAMNELVNQWIGGLERLRWTSIEKPSLKSADTNQSSRKAGAVYPRESAGQTSASWSAQWQALHTLAASQSQKIPMAGNNLVPLETYLRGRGLNRLADDLVKEVKKADSRLQSLQPTNKAGVSQAVHALSGLSKLAENKAAPSLEVNIGFSDADGD